MPRRAQPSWHVREQVYRTDVGGRTKRFYGIAKGDNAALQRAFAEYLEELDAERRPAEPSGLDVALAFTAKPMGRKPRTVETHRGRLAAFCAFRPKGSGPLGAIVASEYRPAHLRGMIRAMQEAGNSPHYIGGIVSSVKAAFAWAASEESGPLIGADPFGKDVKGPSIPKAPERYAERAEVAAFLRFAWRQAGRKPGALMRRFARLLVLLVRVSAHTGARPGSLASAWWDDFDALRGVIVLPPDRHKTGRKTGKPLTIHLPPILVRALLRERDRDGRHPVAIFTHKRGRGGVDRGAGRDAGEPWGEFTTLPNGRPSFDADTRPLCRAVREIRAEAVEEAARLAREGKSTRGLELVEDTGDNRFVIYRLRHTRASDDLMNGGQIATVAGLLGTSPRMIEQVYGHLLEGHMEQAAKDLHARRRSRGK